MHLNLQFTKYKPFYTIFITQSNRMTNQQRRITHPRKLKESNGIRVGQQVHVIPNETLRYEMGHRAGDTWTVDEIYSEGKVELAIVSHKDGKSSIVKTSRLYL